jgi:mandelamide amidase
MARTVADLVLLDGVITQDVTTLAPASLKGLRIGVPRAYYYDNLDPATAQAVSTALANMKAAGVELVEADLPDVPDLNAKVGFPVALFEVMRDLPAYLTRHETGVTMQQLADKIASPDVKGVITSTMGDGAIPASVYQAAMTQFRPKMQQAYAEYFVRNGVTAMVFPTTPLPARPIEGSDETVELNGQRVPTFPTYIRNTDPDSNAGIPGLTIPVGLTADGLPVGLELDGPAWSDRQLLAIGLALEGLVGRLPPPAR